MMDALMMRTPLLVSSILRHAEQNFAEREIVSRCDGDRTFIYNYSGLADRSRRLANWLSSLGVVPGDRIATLAMNTHRHLELYYAVPGMGAVCHTLNPRLTPDELVYILGHAGSRMVFFDPAFASIIDSIRERLPLVEAYIVLAREGAGNAGQDTLFYESIISNSDASFSWPELDENSASGLCYTSGTTGHPKGVLYSQRSTVLHAMGCAMPNALDIRSSDCLLPVVPMFHVNAWGLPYTAAMCGVKLVMPGAKLDGRSLINLFNTEGVTFSAGVPTIWHGIISELEASGAKLPTMKRFVVGGSALPTSMINYFRDQHEIDIIQGWGMTETSPLCTASTPKGEIESDLDLALDTNRRASQGWSLFGAEIKTVSEDGKTLPRDGLSAGELLVRGPWVCRAYFSNSSDLLVDGWFPTGDIAIIDPEGHMRITDRVKDLIKSGGEWISSIELEDAAMSHPGVAQAAVISCRHKRWGERPLMLVTSVSNVELDTQELDMFLSERLERWKRPQAIELVDALPLGATGKVLKTRLRSNFADYIFQD